MLAPGCSSESNSGRGRGCGRGRGRFRPNEDQGERGANRDKSYIRCYNCQEYGHYAYECPKSKPKEEEANFIKEDNFGPALM
ncbi:hypothetical protein E3N88_07288 [Mikania micrantha]|uniref:CCHC-type domain-containing protein n=1 Tax=Mikania micrantha TaxID=192012 RepID=A0A5N6PS79_9ASTR|nr:hypothetical protein E3N88_07288 [Mikania micrantha]